MIKDYHGVDKMTGQRVYIFISAIATLLVIASYIIEVQQLLLIATILICCTFFVCNMKTANCMLFYFNAFSYVFVFKNFNVFVFIANSYILSTIIKEHQNKNGFLYVIFVVLYSMVITVFGSLSYKFGDFISVIMLMLVYFVCSSANSEDFEDITNSFILGFIITAILGFFITKIPTLNNILIQDGLWVKTGTSANLNYVFRYSGLTFDTNFFGLIDCVVISILLFRNHTKYKRLVKYAIIFCVVVGMATYSKTFFLVLMFVFGVYVIQLDRRFLKRVLSILFLGIIYCCIDYMFSLNYISRIIERFLESSKLGDYTTGRNLLWHQYLKYVFMNGSTVAFCSGIGTSSYRIAEHNTYLECVVKYGFVGLFIWYKYFNICYRTLKLKSIKGESKFLVVPLLVCLFYIFALSSMTFMSLPMLICISMFNMRQSSYEKEVQISNCKDLREF